MPGQSYTPSYMQPRQRDPSIPVSIVPAPEGMVKVTLDKDLRVIRTAVQLILYTFDAEIRNNMLKDTPDYRLLYGLRPFYATDFYGHFEPDCHSDLKRNGACDCGDQACRELGYDKPYIGRESYRGTKIHRVPEINIEARQEWLRTLAEKKEKARQKYQERKAAVEA